MTDHTSLKDRLVWARSTRGWSQQTLADKSGVAAAQISRYESGRSSPRPEVIAKLAGAIGITFEWLFAGQGQAALEELADSQDGDRARGDSLRALLPEGLVNRLDRCARKAQRSLAAEVRERLQRSLDEVPQQVELKIVGNIRRTNRAGEVEELTMDQFAQEVAERIVKKRLVEADKDTAKNPRKTPSKIG